MMRHEIELSFWGIEVKMLSGVLLNRVLCFAEVQTCAALRFVEQHSHMAKDMASDVISALESRRTGRRVFEVDAEGAAVSK